VVLENADWFLQGILAPLLCFTVTILSLSLFIYIYIYIQKIWPNQAGILLEAHLNAEKNFLEDAGEEFCGGEKYLIAKNSKHDVECLSKNFTV